MMAAVVRFPGTAFPLSRVDAELVEKRYRTAQARAALRRVVLTRTERDFGGGWEYFASLGAWTKRLDSLDEVERLLDRLEGKA